MHLSFYKRPLVILLIVYTLVLALFLKTPKTDNSFLNFTQTPLSLQGEVVILLTTSTNVLYENEEILF